MTIIRAVGGRGVVRALMDRAMNSAAFPIDPAVRGEMIIKSVSAKQRPIRP